MPPRSVGAHAAASASGVKPSWPSASRRPHVGEAERGDLLEPLAVRVERHTGDGNGDAEAARDVGHRANLRHLPDGISGRRAL